MNDIQCEVEHCPNKLNSMCIAENISISAKGKCLTMKYLKSFENSCSTCKNCIILKMAKSYYRPYCELNNIMDFNNNNECWIEKNTPE